MAVKTTTETRKSDIDPLFYDQIKKIMEELNTLYGEGYQPYEGKRIADWTEDQKNLYDQVMGRIGWGEEDIKTGIDRLKDMPEWGTEQADKYMSPYLDKVLDRSRGRTFDAYDIAKRKRDAQAVSAGAFGGDRQYVTEGQAEGKMLDRLAAQEALAYDKAYSKAYDAYAGDRTRDITTAQGIGNLVGQVQNLWGTQVGAAGTVADAQQGMDQAGLDLAYGDFERQRMFPYEQLNYYMGGVQGFPSSMVPGTQTITSTSPTMSNWGRLAGLGINALGLYGAGGGFNPGGFSMSNLFPYGQA